jgi:hypothetical protein
MEQLVPLNWHENFIVSLAEVVRPSVYVELGLFQCNLFNRIIPFAQLLIGVDLRPEAGQCMQQSPKAQFFNLSTQTFAEYLKNQSIIIDLLFIDADHAKDAVLTDFDNFFPFIAPHGLILLHDTHPNPEHIRPDYCGTAYQAAEILSRNTGDYELVTIPIPPGLTICRKRKKQLAWEEH